MRMRSALGYACALVLAGCSSSNTSVGSPADSTNPGGGGGGDDASTGVMMPSDGATDSRPGSTQAGDGSSDSNGTTVGSDAANDSSADAGDVGVVSPPCGAMGESCCATGSPCGSGLACNAGTCGPARTSATGTQCAKNSDCASGICIDLGNGGGACSTGCSTTTDCVSGWSCSPLIGQPTNVCQCKPTSESCNGKDDDCDGIIDDNLSATACGSPTMYACVSGACTCKNTCGGTTCVDLNNDSKNCGACGNACQAGCTAGECELVIAQGLPINATKFVIDSAFAYWAEYGSPANVYKATLTGGGPKVAFYTEPSSGAVMSVALDSSNLYWGERTFTSPVDIRRQPLAGGTSTPAWQATGFGLLLGPDLAVDATNLYWTDTTNHVFAVPKSGGTESMVFGNTSQATIAGALIAHNGSLYFATNPATPGTGSIYVVPAGGSVQWLADLSSAQIAGIAVDDTTIYVAGRSSIGTGILKLPIAGGSPTLLLGDANVSTIGAIAVDASSVYWFDGGASPKILAAPTSGGSPRVVATVPTGVQVQEIAIDSTNVYWLTYDSAAQNHSILGIPK